MFLGANGRHPDYDRALGAPLAPATNATGSNSERLLVRNFDSGTNVTWDLDKGTGIIYWYGTVRSIEKHGKNRAGRPPKHRANHTLCPTATRAGFKGGWYLVPVTYYPVLGVGWDVPIAMNVVSTPDPKSATANRVLDSSFVRYIRDHA